MADASRTGILLVNLGTPDEPTPAAVRRYLRQFLSDPRVVNIPRLVWWPILHGLILPLRPARSARKYAAIWTPQGSPLRVHTERQARLVEGFLSTQVKAPYSVEWAMRYGQPSIAYRLKSLAAAGCRRILVLPLYPQYAASTTASVADEVNRCLEDRGNAPQLRLVESFHDNPAFIAALAAAVRRHWERNGRGDMLLMSFHGLPQKVHARGDPYHGQCQATAALLAQALLLPSNGVGSPGTELEFAL